MIQINEDFRLSADDWNYTLEERKIKGEKAREDEVGKEIWKNVGYYGTVVDALEGLLRILQRRSVKNTDLTLAEARLEFAKLQDMVNRWCEELSSK